eukprot:gene1329-1451_t
MVEIGDSFHPWEQWWPVSEGEELFLLDDDNCLLDNFLVKADASFTWPPESFEARPSSNSSETCLKPKKRKYVPLIGEARERRNARRRLGIRRIRLPKEDLRRNLPTMIANVTNSGDKSLLETFLQRYCRPDVHMIDFSPKVDMCDEAFSYVSFIQGVQQMARYLSSFSIFFPDISIQIQGSELRLRADGSCVIITKMVFSGTLLFRLPIDDVHQRMKRLLDQGNTVVKESKERLIAKGPQAEEVTSLIRQCCSLWGSWEEVELAVMPKPVDVSTAGFIVMHLDEIGAVQSLDMFDNVAPENFIYSPNEEL